MWHICNVMPGVLSHTLVISTGQGWCYNPLAKGGVTILGNNAWSVTTYCSELNWQRVVLYFLVLMIRVLPQTVVVPTG